MLYATLIVECIYLLLLLLLYYYYFNATVLSQLHCNVLQSNQCSVVSRIEYFACVQKSDQITLMQIKMVNATHKCNGEALHSSKTQMD